MDTPPWLPVVIGLATPVALGLWHAYQYLTSRKDQAEVRRETNEEKHLGHLAAQRAQLAADNAAMFATVRGELDRKDKALVECEHDRHAGWNLARAWYGLAWRMQGEARQARQIVESARRLAGEPACDWPGGSLDLPPFEQAGSAASPQSPIR